tara:strand:- start:2252 stop:2386 length:135 start_codon:yes stop_codon:yes gene_type:complete
MVGGENVFLKKSGIVVIVVIVVVVAHDGKLGVEIEEAGKCEWMI